MFKKSYYLLFSLLSIPYSIFIVLLDEPNFIRGLLIDFRNLPLTLSHSYFIGLFIYYIILSAIFIVLITHSFNKFSGFEKILPLLSVPISIIIILFSNNAIYHHEFGRFTISLFLLTIFIYLGLKIFYKIQNKNKTTKILITLFTAIVFILLFIFLYKFLFIISALLAGGA